MPHPLRCSFAPIIGLVCFGLIAAQPADAASQRRQDADRLIACISAKAGPEGDLPPSGPLRERILAEMKGGPQACLGLVRDACTAANPDAGGCASRETAAWLEALDMREATGRAAGLPKWNAPVKRIKNQAIALCEGAAAISAWGYETVRQKGSYGAGNLEGCILEAVAQQALIMLVHVRGN